MNLNFVVEMILEYLGNRVEQSELRFAVKINYNIIVLSKLSEKALKQYIINKEKYIYIKTAQKFNKFKRSILQYQQMSYKE